ncbi:hypothetical protein CP533_4051 [Ophiocordyceps camponoti-saundersi (nom. inval.)]|nr:hypothetical protein CP533_4051 [Ophiocordyceps camponoti-saundersi (nom. inval.)]
MKFAKQLERDAVPEWRAKYLNYKVGKKHVKAVSRALGRTPRSLAPPTDRDTSDAQDDPLELPLPAIRPSHERSRLLAPSDVVRRGLSRLRRASVSLTSAPQPTATRPRRGTDESPSHLRRIWTREPQFDLVRERVRELYDFMDAELEKVDNFYRFKERQAGQRLALLREQLHEMRNRRLQEMAVSPERDDDNGAASQLGWVQAKMFRPGPNSKALRAMPPTPADERRDYSRRPHDDDVSYRTAKHKLKLALQELYRALELLKAYALLNRTAFRKLNKKFDKATNANPPLRYMHERVNGAWFVTSDVLEGHVKTVEDLYARYFERGNHKLAAGKLRSLSRKVTDESAISFLNGVLIGTGVVFAVQGLAHGTRLLAEGDALVRSRTSYLLQLYGGYFMMLLLFSLFCIDCFVWTRSKVNFPFIFEFDQRSHIDWRRLAEFPSFFLSLLGIFMWINFSGYGGERMFLYYPILLVCITLFVIFFPAPVLAHKSRKWFVYAHWRLLLAGIYPVEFRDFFLGDMYCSLTYSMANVELFFCLYVNQWDRPTQCNSNHSRLLGFFLTLPAIWRLLQCLRRYRDTCNVFPHLVNGGKYAMTIGTYVMLSLYRVDGSQTNLGLFIAVATINGVYTSVWDLFMDFSLLQTHSRHPFLRDILALKWRWPYYAVMVLDPVLRFSWIFYAIFTHNTQHSTIVSFLVSLTEVLRRGLWALFRVENEHCANVAQYKASRDVPLPYHIEPLMDRASEDLSPVGQVTEDLQPQPSPQQRQQQQQQGEEHGGARSSAVASSPEAIRRRTEPILRGSLSRRLASAHTQDFVKRRKPPSVRASGDRGAATADGYGDGFEDDDDDDDDDDDEEQGRVGLAADHPLNRLGEQHAKRGPERPGS